MNTEIEQVNGAGSGGNAQNQEITDVGRYNNNKVDIPPESRTCKLEVLSEGEDEQEPVTKQQTPLKLENTDLKRTTEDESMAVEALRQLGGMFDCMPPTSTPLAATVPVTATKMPYRQHVCNICGESFERKSDLGNHIVCHQVDRPHACRICGNLFRRKADLQNHMVCHQVERPHRCPQCGADFQRPSSLSNHMKIHSYAPGRALMDSDSSSTNYQNFNTTTTSTVNQIPQVQMPSYNGWDVGYTNNVLLDPNNYQSNPVKDNSTNEFNYERNSEQIPVETIHSLENQQVNASAAIQQPAEMCNMNNYGNVMNVNNINNGSPLNYNSKNYGEDGVKVEVTPCMPTTNQHYGSSAVDPPKNPERPHVCRHCGLAFGRAKALESHARLHQDHWGSPVECDRCEEMFPEEASLHQHRETCLGKVVQEHQPPQKQIQEVPTNSTQSTKLGKHACTECEKRFTTKQKLFRHLWIHRKRPYVCEVCGVSLADRMTLDKHRRDHHPGDTPFTCSECGKSFVSRQGLWEHGRVHSGNGVSNTSPFLCQRCGKSFASRQGHLIHMRTHTGERPYGCRFCWKAFRDGGTLRKHERIHTGERPHVCPLCPRAFNQKVVLREHVRWVHAARNSDGCQLCGYVVSDREALCAHIVKHSDQLAAATKAAKGKQEPSKTITPQVLPVNSYNNSASNYSYTPNETTDTNMNNKVMSPDKSVFSCDMCGEKFQMRTELLNHVRIHI